MYVFHLVCACVLLYELDIAKRYLGTVPHSNEGPHLMYHLSTISSIKLVCCKPN